MIYQTKSLFKSILIALLSAFILSACNQQFAMESQAMDKDNEESSQSEEGFYLANEFDRSQSGNLGNEKVTEVDWLLSEERYSNPPAWFQPQEIKLNPYDKINLRYVISYDQIKDYKSKYEINIGDRIAIDFKSSEEKDAEIEVSQNGMVNIAHIGNTEAAGLTIIELERKIIEKLTNEILIPKVDIDVVYFSDSLYELKKAIGYENGNLFSEIVIDKDYNIDLPFIGKVNTKNRELSSVQQEAENRYDSIFPDNSKIQLLMWQDGKDDANEYFYALGAFRNTGRHQIETKPITLMQAISQAGGFKRKALYSGILNHYSRDNNNNAFHRKIDLGTYVNNVDISKDYIVLPGDVIKIMIYK